MRRLLGKLDLEFRAVQHPEGLGPVPPGREDVVPALHVFLEQLDAFLFLLGELDVVEDSALGLGVLLDVLL